MVQADSMDELCAQSLVWDCHAGTAPHPDVDLSCLDAWHKADVDFISMNIGFDAMDWEACLATATSYKKQVSALPDIAVLARTLDDVRAAKASGRIAVAFDIEGANALNEDLELVSTYHDLGVRQMLLAISTPQRPGVATMMTRD